MPQVLWQASSVVRDIYWQCSPGSVCPNSIKSILDYCTLVSRLGRLVHNIAQTAVIPSGTDLWPKANDVTQDAERLFLGLLGKRHLCLPAGLDWARLWGWICWRHSDITIGEVVWDQSKHRLVSNDVERDTICWSHCVSSLLGSFWS